MSNEREFKAASHARDLIAFRALGMLKSLYEGRELPDVHRPHANEIIEAYRVATETLDAIEAAWVAANRIKTYGPTEPPQRSRQDNDEQPYYDARDERNA